MSESKPNRGIPSQRGLLIRLIGIIGLLMTTMMVMRYHIANHPPSEFNEHLSPLPAPNDPDQTVETGLYVHNIYAFEADKKIFDADGWIWLKYSKALNDYMLSQGILPANLIHFVNQVDDYDFSLDPSIDQPILMPDGRYYQKFRFSGHFYVDELDFRKFPFQTISLPVIVEIRGQRLHRDASPVQLVVDKNDSGIGAYIDVSGYETKGFSIEGATEHFMSRMGNPLADEKGSKSELRLTVHYQKALNSTFLKFILPLITVMLLTLFSPSIAPMGWEVLVGIPSTSLLTLIFLQQTYQSSIPDFHYLTFLDSIYNLCYMVDLILFALFLWAAKIYHAAAEEDHKIVAAYIEKIDHRFQVVLTLGLIFGVVGDWWFHFL
ncbi:MAG TPA: hypothetical protein DCY52_03730 [Methylococcaceae bacterium]|nr:hypothetical protein [Methylococcaceae bacterium]